MGSVVQLKSDGIEIAMVTAEGSDIFDDAVMRAIANADHAAVDLARRDPPHRKVAQDGRIGFVGRCVLQKPIEIARLAIFDDQAVGWSIDPDRTVTEIEELAIADDHIGFRPQSFSALAARAGRRSRTTERSAIDAGGC